MVAVNAPAAPDSPPLPSSALPTGVSPTASALVTFSPPTVSSSVTVDGRLRIELEFSQLSISASPTAPTPVPSPLNVPASQPKARQEVNISHHADANAPRIRDCVKCSSQHTRPPPGSIYPDIGNLPCQCRVPWIPAREHSRLIPSRTPSPPGAAPRRKDRLSKGKQVDRRSHYTPATSPSPSLASSVRGRQFLAPSPVKREEGPSHRQPAARLVPDQSPPPTQEQSVAPPTQEQSVQSDSVSSRLRPRRVLRHTRVVSVSDVASISSDAATYESPDEGRPNRKWYVVTKGTKVGIFKDWLKVLRYAAPGGMAKKPTKREARQSYQAAKRDGAIKVGKFK